MLHFNLFVLFLSICGCSNAEFGVSKRASPNNNDSPRNPITDYEYYEIQVNNKTTRIPKMARAILKELNSASGRNSFGASFDAQMKAMHAAKNDEKGHVIASQFNGPALDYNMVPMGNYQNRNFLVKNVFMASYYDMEMRMKDFISAGCGSVDLKVDVQYEPKGQPQSYRPKSFDMYHTFVYKIDGKDVYQPRSHLYTSFENRMGLVNIPEHLVKENNLGKLTHFNPLRLPDNMAGPPQKKNKAN